MAKVSYSVFILRGQPFHLGHKAIIQEALQKTQAVLILIGSYRTPVTIKNPWSFEAREDMIRGSMTLDENARILVRPIRDFLYSIHTWVTSLQNVVTVNTDGDDITLYGHFKDDSSFYLNLFPQWKLAQMPNIKSNGRSIDSTLIRNFMYENNDSWRPLVTEYVASVLESYMQTDEFQRMVREFKFIENYKKTWEKAPYPPTFVTTDAVVVQSGHVLLVVRGREPGKGYYALPGGFLNQGESIRQCTIRELKEETKIDVPSVILDKCITDTVTFDHPLRDLRGRTISHASLIELDYNKPLPRIKGSDDAAEAVWMPFNELGLHEEKFFADHIHIIGRFMSGKLYNR